MSTERTTFSPPLGALVKEARRQGRARFAKFVAVVSLITGAFYALHACGANAQSMLPYPKPEPRVTPAVYGSVMVMMLNCRPGAAILPRDTLANNLLQQYGEVHENTIYLMPNAVAEVYINRDAGSWTIIRSGPQKQACFVADGLHAFPPREIGV
jgi:hypothetical protein